MDELQRHRSIQQLGQRALDYYIDTGLCVFCEADDCLEVPHEEHCNVGEVSGVVVDVARKSLKQQQREAFHNIVFRGAKRPMEPL